MNENTAQPVGRISFASGEVLTYTDPEKYLQAVREELPYHPVTGFRFETLSGDPAVRKAADDAVYDLYGEEGPRPLEDYEKAEMTMEPELGEGPGMAMGWMR